IEAACEQLGRALDPDAERVYALQRFVLHIEQGEPALAAQALDAMTGPRPIWTCLRAWAWTALGDRERSAHALPDPRDIPVDGEWLVSMSALAHAVAGLGDAGTAAVVAPSLERFADRMATVGGIVCLGSVAYPAG